MSKKDDRNPFATDRWEDERDHLFWLPSSFEKLERNRCVYLIGTRGAGKTTILKALDWNERLTNKSLQNQIREKNGEDLFSKHFVGIYIDVGKKYILKNFYSWLKKEHSSIDTIVVERGRLFSLYIEYLAIFNLIEAIEGLRNEKIIKYLPSQEQRVINTILKVRPEIKNFIRTNGEYYILEDIRLAIKKIYEKIWNDSQITDSGTLSNELPNLQIGLVLGELSKPLLGLCNTKTEKYIVKVCIDSVESLDLELIRSLNTLIATHEEHTTFVFASTHEFIDTESTFVPDHPLTQDDRDIITLEKFYDEFLTFVEGVTRLRFEKVLEHSSFDVEIKKILGDYSLNRLLDYELKKTISVEYQDFAKSVQNDFSKKWNRLLKSVGKEAPKDPPYIEAYLTKKLNINLDKYFNKMNEFSILHSSQYRKKQRSAMLCLCYDSEYPSNLSVPYAGYRMVLNMSDSNIRDFIRQMRNIYDVSIHKREKFLENTVPLEIQKKGIRTASEVKYSEIERGSSYAIEISNMVRVLGNITHILQTTSQDALRITERGTYIIDYLKLPTQEKRENLHKIIFTASVNKYYINVVDVILNPNDRSIVSQKIRLHRLFAPLFDFSYISTNTGREYEMEINPNDLLEICDTPLKEDFREIADRMSKRITPGVNGGQKTLLNWHTND